jgi:hypothetical protein
MDLLLSNPVVYGFATDLTEKACLDYGYQLNRVCTLQTVVALHSFAMAFVKFIAIEEPLLT